MSTSLKLSLNDKVCYLPQSLRLRAKTLQRLICVAPQFLGKLVRARWHKKVLLLENGGARPRSALA